MKKIKVKNFSPIYDELEKECLKTVSYIEALKVKKLNKTQKEEIEGNLYGSISILKFRTELLEKEFFDV